MGVQSSNTIYSDDLLKNAVNVALYYGFMPASRVAAEVEKVKPKKLNERKVHVPRSSLDPFSQELHQALRTYAEKNFEHLTKPVLFYHSNIDTGKKILKDEPIHFGFQAIGSGKSIAEALVIKAALDVLADLHQSEICIHINTIGDKDSVARYSRELSNYFRKHIADLPASAQALLRKDPLQCLRYLQKKEHPLFDTAPGSMEYLSEKSRRHAREILEYLESVDVPYVIDKSLVGTSDYRPETVFEIRSFDDEVYDATKNTDPVVFARGCRYDDLSKKMFRSNIPAAGIVFESRKRGTGQKDILNPKRVKQPKIHFIQFGFDAKLKSLMVIDALRRAKVPIYQSLGNDRLTQQLEIAEEMGTPFTVIMGQKEVLDHTVIIRNMNNRSQEIIHIDRLPDFLKTMKI